MDFDQELENIELCDKLVMFPAPIVLSDFTPLCNSEFENGI
jgi:hypothetical protein